MEKQPYYYKEQDKMCDLVTSNYESLQVLSRFGLPIGFGDKTIRQVCYENQVDTSTFLAVVNFKIETDVNSRNLAISIPSLIQYLQNAHSYFLDFFMPMIRRKLIEAINVTVENRIQYMIIKFYDDYMEEVRRHMEYENTTVFKYVHELLKGNNPGNYSILKYVEHHNLVDNEHVEAKLTELKNIIIKYYPSNTNNELLNSALFDIFTCEKDLATHGAVENKLFVPAVIRLEKSLTNVNSKTEPAQKMSENSDSEELSSREKEVLIGVARGFTNKEIADQLFISVHTVTTHRKNIAKKLQIHSPAGLTIYAIVNKLVDIESIKTN